MFIAILLDSNPYCIDLLSSKSSRIFPSSHIFQGLSSALRWMFHFDNLLSFCRSILHYIYCFYWQPFLTVIHWSISSKVYYVNL